jgi:chromosome transmission fidelity protein 18
MKEADSSYMSVLGDLFAPMTRKRVKELAVTEAEEAAYVGRLSRSIEASGATDRIALGCFEHYLNLRKHDATFERYIKAEEWLIMYDVLNGAMRAEREYALMPYMSYALVPFYPLFHERGGLKVERPKADWEVSLFPNHHERKATLLTPKCRAISSLVRTKIFTSHFPRGSVWQALPGAVTSGI